MRRPISRARVVTDRPRFGSPGRAEAKHLEAQRKSIMEIVPEANQFISYGTPAFKTYLPSPVEPIAQNCPSAVNLCAPNARTEHH
jgi:hypothetical protein